MVPRKDCPHINFEAEVKVTRLGQKDYANSPVKDFVLDVRVKCAECKGDFMFNGLDVAISTQRPCVSVSRTEASIPIAPWDGALGTGNIPIELPS